MVFHLITETYILYTFEILNIKKYWRAKVIHVRRTCKSKSWDFKNYCRNFENTTTSILLSVWDYLHVNYVTIFTLSTNEFCAVKSPRLEIVREFSYYCARARHLCSLSFLWNMQTRFRVTTEILLLLTMKSLLESFST